MMPAKDAFHDSVRSALEREGWTVTDDPYFVNYGGKRIYVDLAAERPTVSSSRSRWK